MPSHLIASSPARCRVVRPPGNLDRGQSFTVWLIVCFAAPQTRENQSCLSPEYRQLCMCFYFHFSYYFYLYRYTDDDIVDTSGDVKTVADYYSEVATEEWVHTLAILVGLKSMSHKPWIAARKMTLENRPFACKLGDRYPVFLADRSAIHSIISLTWTDHFLNISTI